MEEEDGSRWALEKKVPFLERHSGGFDGPLDFTALIISLLIVGYTTPADQFGWWMTRKNHRLDLQEKWTALGLLLQTAGIVYFLVFIF